MPRNVSPKCEANLADLRQYFLYLKTERRWSRQSSTQAILRRYVFKTATNNRRLPLLPDGRVRWVYRDSQSGQSVSLRLEPLEVIRRFLQHILPPGFHRVRRFGWLHPARRVQLNRVRALLHQPALLTPAQRAAWQSPPSDFEPPEPLPPPDHTPRCPKCQRPMVRVGRWSKGHLPPDPSARAPPSS